MSKTPDDNTTARTLTPSTQDLDPDEDESTLSPELAKLERILSRKTGVEFRGDQKGHKAAIRNRRNNKETARYDRGVEEGKL